MIAWTCAGNIEQVTLGIVDLFQIRIVADRLDPLLGGNHLVVAGHDGNRSELEALGQVHGADRNPSAYRVNMLIQHLEPETRRFNRRPRSIQLRGGANKHADFTRLDALTNSFLEPLADSGYLLCL